MDIERERGITIKLNTARMDVNENGEDHAIYFFSTSGPFSHVHMSCHSVGGLCPESYRASLEMVIGCYWCCNSASLNRFEVSLA